MEYDKILDRLKELSETPASSSSNISSTSNISNTSTELVNAPAAPAALPNPEELLLHTFKGQVLDLCAMAQKRGIDEASVEAWKVYATHNTKQLFKLFGTIDTDKIKARDVSLVDEYSFLKGVDTSDLAEVWPLLDSMAQNLTFNQLYKMCPSGMINKISSLALDISTKIEKGEMKASDINPMALAGELTSTMSKEMMESFAKNVTGANVSMPGMMGLMSSLMKKI